MKLPAKITPDRIRDSIVQIFFTSEIPFEAQIGIFYSVLGKNGWKFTNRHPLQEPAKGLTIEIGSPQQHFFIKDKVRIQLFPNNSFAFNCIGSYLGWPEFQLIIREVIKLLSDGIPLKQFTRVGIRYISEFRGVDIVDHVNLSTQISGITGELKTSTFRFIFNEASISKNIQITSKLPVNPQVNRSESVSFTSLLDVDIVEKNLKINDLDTLFEVIEKLHTVEKETFFGLLKTEFLHSLNPEYS